MKYALTYFLLDEWINSAGNISTDDRELPHDLVMVFGYTDEEFEKLGLEKTVTHVDIVAKNPANPILLPTTQHPEEQVVIKLIINKKEPMISKLESLKEEYTSQPATLTVNRMTITMGKSIMQGFGVCKATRQGIENILRAGLIIPSQKS